MFVALLALVALATAVSLPMGKFPRKPVSMAEASVLASGHGVPLKGNIPNYGEYVPSFAIICCYLGVLVALRCLSLQVHASGVPVAPYFWISVLETSEEPFSRL